VAVDRRAKIKVVWNVDKYWVFQAHIKRCLPFFTLVRLSLYILRLSTQEHISARIFVENIWLEIPADL
jgi:hypothetical protein